MIFKHYLEKGEFGFGLVFSHLTPYADHKYMIDFHCGWYCAYIQFGRTVK